MTRWNETKKRCQATHDHQMDGPGSHLQSTWYRQVCPGRTPKRAELRAVLKDTPTPQEADSRADSRSTCQGERAEQRCSHGKPGARRHSTLTQPAHTARSHTQPAGRGAARPRPRRLTLLSGSPGSAASSLETNLSTLLSEACLLWPMLFSKCAC